MLDDRGETIVMRGPRMVLEGGKIVVRSSPWKG